jgi:hypothetical protein
LKNEAITKAKSEANELLLNKTSFWVRAGKMNDEVGNEADGVSRLKERIKVRLHTIRSLTMARLPLATMSVEQTVVDKSRISSLASLLIELVPK